MTSRRRPEDGGEKAEVKYLKDTVYDQIKTKIIECEYPPDSILTEARLMEVQASAARRFGRPSIVWRMKIW